MPLGQVCRGQEGFQYERRVVSLLLADLLSSSLRALFLFLHFQSPFHGFASNDMRVQSSTCSGSHRRCHRCCEHPGSSTGIPALLQGNAAAPSERRGTGPSHSSVVRRRGWRSGEGLNKPAGCWRALFRYWRDAGGPEAGRYGSVGMTNVWLLSCCCCR